MPVLYSWEMRRWKQRYLIIQDGSDVGKKCTNVLLSYLYAASDTHKYLSRHDLHIFVKILKTKRFLHKYNLPY